RLTADQQVKVLDFGLARRITSVIDTSGLTIERVLETLSGQPIAGTPGYMSPEQALGRAVGPPADVFSLGVVLFEMLAGRRPFPGSDLISSAVAIVTLPAPRLVDVVPDIALRVDALVARMLSKEPGKRPRANEVLSDLERWSRSAVDPPLRVRR